MNNENDIADRNGNGRRRTRRKERQISNISKSHHITSHYTTAENHFTLYHIIFHDIAVFECKKQKKRII